MSRLVRTLFAVALLVSVASSASADQYPPGPPWRSCADSLTIYQVQQADSLINSCAPVQGDTLKGVRGVITGFRTNSSGARTYMENTQAGDFMGVQIFTGSTNLGLLGFSIGDSISVSGKLGYYNGENQISGYMTPPVTLTVGKVVAAADRGFVMPPFRFGTTSSFRWSPATGAGSAWATCNPLNGMLVKVMGPLRVARTQAGAGLAANGTQWLVVNSDGSAPLDSIMIDGYMLTALAAPVLAPNLGQQVDWVQGILRRNSSNYGADVWMISLRSQADHEVKTSPNLVDAYPIAENKLRLVFDKNVDVLTAQDTLNYTLGSELSGSNVTGATVVIVGSDSSKVDLDITEVTPRLTVESIQAENIGSAKCPTCLSSQQIKYFVLGVLTCAEVQAPLADSLTGAVCLDKSQFAGGGTGWGARMTVRGVYLQKYGSLRAMADQAGGLRGGIFLYNYSNPMTVGNKYLMACRVQEYYTLSELVNTVAVIDEGPVAVPAPQLQTVHVLTDLSCDALQTLTNNEDYEGVLARIENVKVIPFNPDTAGSVLPVQGGSFRVVALPAMADTILVSALGGNYPDFTPVVGQWLNVNGVVNFDNQYDDWARLLPRSTSDIEVRGMLDVTNPAPAKVTFAVGPSPARGVATKVNFALPRQADVDLSVFDLSGRKIATLASGSMAAGPYLREWSGAGASAGVYFIRLRVGSETYNLRTVSLK
jgi:hypothetical protein